MAPDQHQCSGFTRSGDAQACCVVWPNHAQRLTQTVSSRIVSNPRASQNQSSIEESFGRTTHGSGGTCWQVGWWKGPIKETPQQRQQCVRYLHQDVEWSHSVIGSEW